MGVFDALLISGGLSTPLVTIERGTGPIENGYFDNTNTWVPNGGAQFVGAAQDFGVDPVSGVYWDSNGADPGEGGYLFVDPIANTVWIEQLTGVPGNIAPPVIS